MTPSPDTAHPRQDSKRGLPPGTIFYVGKDSARKPQLTLFEYGETAAAETRIDALDRVPANAPDPLVRWLNVDGLADVSLLAEIGKRFDVHPLTMEDVANTHQRPKLDLFDRYAFVTFKMLRMADGPSPAIVAEHVGLVLRDGLVLSFQEAPGDVFDFVRDRIRNGRGRIRSMKADYLVFSLLDAVVDGYFSVLESLGERITEIDERLLHLRPTPGLLREIHALKRQVIYVRRCAWPLRELLGAIQKSPSALFGENVAVYFRDLYDHAAQVIDTIETYRELLSSLTDLYMSISGNRMNEIMKVLTIIATLFIPLTFVAGVYGMNFEHMPELHWPWAYPAVMLSMLAIALGMLAFFRRKGWI